MKLTKEQLIQNAEAMIAFANGRTVQAEFNGGDEWEDCPEPSWGFDIWKFRPKPLPKTRPWNCPEDVPLNCWIQFASRQTQWFIAAIDIDGIGIMRGSLNGHPVCVQVTWKEIEEWKGNYSTDRREWKPCVVTEE